MKRDIGKITFLENPFNHKYWEVHIDSVHLKYIFTMTSNSKIFVTLKNILDDLLCYNTDKNKDYSISAK